MPNDSGATGVFAEVEALTDAYDYWGEHPDYPLQDWRYDVADDNTRLGYWQWVVDRIRCNEDDCDDNNKG